MGLIERSDLAMPTDYAANIEFASRTVKTGALANAGDLVLQRNQRPQVICVDTLGNVETRCCRKVRRQCSLIFASEALVEIDEVPPQPQDLRHTNIIIVSHAHFVAISTVGKAF